MKKAELSILTGLIISIVLSSFSVFANDSRQIKKDILRLHIVANSNSDSDQQLKLEIRDRILKESQALFEPSDDINAAVESAEKSLPELKKAVDETIAKNGYDYDSKVYLCDMFFDTREYESFTLPCGNYKALRIEIGKAQGKNWWCVLFPSLCIGASQKSTELKKAFSDSQIKQITQPKYKAKFKILEIIESIKKSGKKH